MYFIYYIHTKQNAFSVYGIYMYIYCTHKYTIYTSMGGGLISNIETDLTTDWLRSMKCELVRHFTVG